MRQLQVSVAECSDQEDSMDKDEEEMYIDLDEASSIATSSPGAGKKGVRGTHQLANLHRRLNHHHHIRHHHRRLEVITSLA